MEVRYNITNESAVVIVDGENYIIQNDHVHYNEIIKCCLDSKRYKDLLELLDTKEDFNKFGKGNVYIENGVVYDRAHPLHSALSKRIISVYKELKTCKDSQQRKKLKAALPAFLAFANNVRKNPDRKMEEELHLFLEANNLPFTEDGHFIAYKAVSDSYKDLYSGKFDNKPGATPSMKRKEVNPNRDDTCASGLHFASFEYIQSIYSGNKIMKVKVHPKDVVTIPNDYNNQKGRACFYMVLGENKGGANKEDFWSMFHTTEEHTDNYYTDSAGRYRSLATGQYIKKPAVVGSKRDSQGRLRDALGRYIKTNVA